MRFAERILTFERPKLMGVLNLTPDSFSDGGRYTQIDQALRHAVRMFEEGAELIDVGGESTRPGALAVELAEELDRVIPVVERIKRETDALISVDTSQPEVMLEAAQAGAHLINDVRALTRPGALAAARQTGLPVCLMHMQNQPQTMQKAPHYGQVVPEVMAYLRARIEACLAEGMSADQLLIDPGFGFGKQLDHNLALMRALPTLASLAPVVVGVSRKTMIGQLTGRDVHDRVQGSVVAALWAAQQPGVAILRVHDVAQTQDALRVWAALERSQ